jgi:hypothetical protein
MFGDGALTFREFAMGETLPLATIHDAVLEFLRGRNDAVLYGAQAVNAYVSEPRMTQDVDVMSTRGAELAEDIRAMLNKRFFIAARVREVRGGIGYRVYQVRKPENRHLVDVRPVQSLPSAQRVDDVLVLAPVELVCAKVASAVGRPKTAKGLFDLADLRRLLLRFPELKTTTGPVSDRLQQMVGEGEDAKVLETWREVVAQPIEESDDESEFE